MPSSIARRDVDDPTDTRRTFREIADHAFLRAAGAPLRAGNAIRLLKDAAENYPAWLDAIGSARHTVHFECYIIHNDAVGRRFADALMEKARAGVRVRVIYDWVGALGAASPLFWSRMRRAGVEVRCYNPPRLDAPLGWISRDHRKLLSVDATRGFVAGLCVGRAWVGDPARHVEPWRDTGVELRGPAVADLEQAFAEIWNATGRSLSPKQIDEVTRGAADVPARDESLAAGRPQPADWGTSDVAVRVVSTVPSTAKLFRLDQLVAALARERLWLSDAYYAGTAPYVQALRAAAMDGVDVRLLVPGASDVPIIRPLSRAGYRPLLDAGVRVFEWNGTMMHAKTGVADGQWSRVGSSNLNIQSWLGNCELDVMVEDERFARQMEDAYLDDLRHATEIVLVRRRKVRRADGARAAQPASGSGSTGRATAAALRIGNAVAAAMGDSRVLEPAEAYILMMTGLLLLALCALVVVFPRGVAYTVGVLTGWGAVSLLYRSYRLYRARARRTRPR